MSKINLQPVMIFLSVLIIVSSCDEGRGFHFESTPNSNISIPDSLFLPGDIIFREGRGIISDAFRQMSLNDKKYSHAGIIHGYNNQLYVFHTIGGEENKDRKMRMDLLSDFISPLQSNAFAVYRTDLDNMKIDSIASTFYGNEVKFDAEFDLGTLDKLYCTEMVYRILTHVSGNDNYLPLTELSGVKYVSCDNIYLSPHLKNIFTQNKLSN